MQNQMLKEAGRLEIEEKRKELKEKLEIDRNQLEIEKLKLKVTLMKVQNRRLEMEATRNKNEMIMELKMMKEDANELYEGCLVYFTEGLKFNRVQRNRVEQACENLIRKLEEISIFVEIRRINLEERLEIMKEKITKAISIISELSGSLKRKEVIWDPDLVKQLEDSMRDVFGKTDNIEFSPSGLNSVMEQLIEK